MPCLQVAAPRHIVLQTGRDRRQPGERTGCARCAGQRPGGPRAVGVGQVQTPVQDSGGVGGAAHFAPSEGAVQDSGGGLDGQQLPDSGTIGALVDARVGARVVAGVGGGVQGQAGPQGGPGRGVSEAGQRLFGGPVQCGQARFAELVEGGGVQAVVVAVGGGAEPDGGVGELGLGGGGRELGAVPVEDAGEQVDCGRGQQRVGG